MADPQPADDWQPVAAAQPAAPAPPADDWQPVDSQKPPDFTNPGEAAVVAQSTAGRAMDVLWAGWGGVKEGWGSQPLGMSDEDVKWMQEKGLFRTQQNEGVAGVFRAFNEAVLYHGAQALDAALRAPNAIYHGIGDAAIAAGVPRDIVAIPEAFLGSPDALAIPHAPEGAAVHEAGEVAEAPPAAPSAPAAEAVLHEAKNLGVIGPDKPEPTFKDSPSQLAEQAVPHSLSAAVSPADATKILGHEPGEYDARGKEWISKIDEPADVAGVIDKIASENDFFPEARGGVATPAARDAVAEAAGVDPAAIDQSHFATHFDNDGKVRAVIQVLRQTAQDYDVASKKALAEPSLENAAAATEAQLRANHAVEYTLGLRAESGRSLAAWKDLLRQTEETKAGVALREQEQTGAVPPGAADVVGAAGDVRENLKAGKKPGLQKLVDAAQGLVENADNPPPKPGTIHPSPELQSLVDEAKGALKQFSTGDGQDKSRLQRVVDRAQKLAEGAGNAPKEKGATTPMPPELQSLVDEARGVLNGFGKELVTDKSGLQRVVERAQKLAETANKAAADRAKNPMPPELDSLVGEARNVLKNFGADKDKELEAFRGELEKLSSGDGKLGDTVEAARALIEKDAKPKETEPKVVSAKSQLKAAAKRLVAAADGEKAKAAARDSEVQGLMDTARQAVGRLRGMNVSQEIAGFRDALSSKDPEAAAAAARKLIDAEGKTASETKAKVPVEYDQIMSAARSVAGAVEKKAAAEKPENMPDIQELVGNAKSAAEELRGQRRSVLERLIDTAEKNAENMTKQKQVKDPVEALPPELQALVDKTKRVVNRFGGIATGERAALLLARTGRTFEEQQELARSVQGLTPNQVAKVLNKLRTSPESTKPGWFYWLWQQGLISGLLTHTKYLAVNTTTVFLERVVSPLLGAMIDRARGGNSSLTAPLYANVAMVHALPDALSAAAQAFKTGMRVPLESEMRLFERGEESPQTKGAGSAYVQNTSPDWGIWNRVFNETQLDKAAEVLGIPGKSANMVHTFYKVLSERASASSRAFETAHQEGATGDAFWQRFQYHLDHPSDDALRGAVNDAYSGAFMAKLGPRMTTFAHALSKNPVTKWLFPFQHIPWNIERMSAEYSPFAVLGPEMRAAILGKKGAPAQNLAIAKMTVGSSVIGYFMHKTLSGDATGDYPQDADERKKWEMLGIRPNSMKIGGQWVSYERLGPMGNVAHMGAIIGGIVKNYNGQDDDALTSAIWAASIGAANQVGNETGFQSLRNVIDSLESKNKATRFAAYQAGSLMPMSSFMSQNASAMDPYQRKFNTIAEGLKYRVPFLRETLLPKRDPVYGEPVPNPSYHTVTPMAPINIDPVKTEMDRANYFPAAPEDRVGGVKLSPELYDRYQATAGAYAKEMLRALVNSPGWYEQPVYFRKTAMEKTLEAARKGAAAALQVSNPDLLAQGMQQKIDYINGKSPTARPKKPPQVSPAARTMP